MLGIGTGEILLILVIATLVVGPEQMVSFARDMGQLLAKFRQETDGVTEEFREALSMEPGAEEAREAETGDAKGTSEAQGDGTGDLTSVEEEMPAEQMEGAGEEEEAVKKLSVGASRAFIDGERETFSSPSEEEDDDKPVLIVVGEPVPKDEDVEPIVIEEPVLILDGEGQDTEEEEG